MKVVYDTRLLDKIPGLCAGIIALRAADNRKGNMEAEAFCSRCGTEAQLLFKMNPHLASGEISLYEEMQGNEKDFPLKKVVAEFKKGNGMEEMEEEIEVLAAPRRASLDELTGADILERKTPVEDMVRAAMLKFHVNIAAFDMENRKKVLSVSENEISLGEMKVASHFLEGGEELTEDSENIIILITGTDRNRKKVTSARNELARRLKSAFDRAVEVGWIEGETNEFDADIG